MDELQPTDPRQVGRYRITGRLGGGGMGQVYLGHSPSGRLVAVKVVRPELAQDPGFRRRFAREVEAARRVTGFFTAAVVDADPEGATPWLATAYVPGLPLNEAVAAHGPWPVESVRTLGAGLAEALEAIHAAGLVHRDFKPSNILLASDGPRVVDFGISVAAEATALTHTGMIVGTPGFMAPEQLVGRPVTPASDVFALGAVLAYVATGTSPFGTGSAQALNFRIAYEEPDLSRLPGPGLEIIERCLAKDPGQRPSVTTLIGELAPVRRESRSAEPTAPRTATWLPTPVTGALSTTLPLMSAREIPPPAIERPQPAPVPTPSARPTAPARPAAPPPPTASGGRTTYPFWTAILALAIAMVLPPVEGSTVALTSMSEGSWPFVIAAAFGVGTCTTALFLAHSSHTAPVPRWPRYLHALATVLNGSLLLLYHSVGEKDFALYRGGGYALALASVTLLLGLIRFPTSRRGATW
ncbi:serine/threonine-protein kinase [Streptomyces castrisilvae]|uniref:Serine/threonine-protein kinase n=1 Tax=Streptomyces castrisilvae TaxID=3033811 RepID=A0ABY9HIJ9_9ACTN|nr:serine/threonine-protein kinase [Streptomyces sp. Mut1]WLQ33989.1 serine/threonine-protein kinase [Streptomyces sp. Mut1]